MTKTTKEELVTMPRAITKAATPVDVEVGRRIKLQRLQAGLSQGTLATQIGVTFQQVQKYEKGSNRVAPGRLSQIAQILNVPVSSFFEADAKAGTKASSVAAILTRPHVLRLLTAFDAVPQNVQRTVVHLLEELASTSSPPANRSPTAEVQKKSADKPA